MTISAMCDNCGTHENPNRIFQLTVPHSSTRLDFCKKECVIEYLNREY